MGSAFWRENAPKEGLGGPRDWPGPNIEGVQPNQLPGDHNPPPETKHRCSNRVIADRVGKPSPRRSGRFWNGRTRWQISGPIDADRAADGLKKRR